jgi:TDG/mug DNA glycosylase family protein
MPSAEGRMPSAECRAPSAELRAPSAERRPPSAERRMPSAEMQIPADKYKDKRLKDRIRPGLRVLFVGINPGVRSALTGHHFAGFSNRFWKLLSESELVPEPLTYLDDARLPEFGFGITNLIARPSPGIDDLKPLEYAAGWHALDRKVRRFAPEVVALVGVTLYRAVLPFIAAAPGDAYEQHVHGKPRTDVVGLQPFSFRTARVFVLPNPSGRNANFSYAEMLDAFTALRRLLLRRV